MHIFFIFSSKQQIHRWNFSYESWSSSKLRIFSNFSRFFHDVQTQALLLQTPTELFEFTKLIQSFLPLTNGVYSNHPCWSICLLVCPYLDISETDHYFFSNFLHKVTGHLRGLKVTRSHFWKKKSLKNQFFVTLTETVH